MRILAITDVHLPKGLYERLLRLKKKHNPDILCCSGDLSIFTRGQKEVLKSIAKVGLPTFIIHGNHDDYTTFAEYCKKTKNMVNVHKKIVEYGGYLILGWGGEGFRYIQPDFERWAQGAEKVIKKQAKPCIVLTHQPLFGTPMDTMWGNAHVGSKSFRKFVDKNSAYINLVLSGHIHEGFRKMCKIKKTIVINPGNAGIVITL